MTTATEPSYRIRTYVTTPDGVGSQEWPDETVTAGEDYAIGDDLESICLALAERAWDNTDWAHPENVCYINVAILAAEDDPSTYELARNAYEVPDHPPMTWGR